MSKAALFEIVKDEIFDGELPDKGVDDARDLLKLQEKLKTREGAYDIYVRFTFYSKDGSWMPLCNAEN